MTAEERNMREDALKELKEAHEEYLPAKSRYEKASKRVEAFTHKESATYHDYRVIYDDSSYTIVDWEAIKRHYPDFDKDAFTVKVPNKRFRKVVYLKEDANV